MQLDLSVVFRRREVTFRLLVIGIPLALALGTLTAVLVLPVMPLWEAVCLAAIVAPTEVALIDALLEDKRIACNTEIRVAHYSRPGGSTEVTLAAWQHHCGRALVGDVYATTPMPRAPSCARRRSVEVRPEVRSPEAGPGNSTS